MYTQIAKIILSFIFVLFLSLINRKEIFFQPDFSISNIYLLDSASVLAKYEKGLMRYLENSPTKSYVHLYSKDQSEIAKLFFHAGNYNNEFSEFEISFNKEATGNSKVVIAEEHFLTESNICLGMTLNEVVSTKGTEYEKSQMNNKLIIRYVVDEYQNNLFLQKYNYPIYYAEYIFDNNILIKFKFGFDYP